MSTTIAPVDATQAAPPARRRVMNLLDVTLFMVSAMLVIDQLTASASIGTGAVGWWIVVPVVFLIPSAFITAELATTYPEQGGIYVWVRKAYGRHWAARTTYWYYVNVALWMPSVFLLLSGIFSQLFVHRWVDWGSGKWPQAVLAIALVWLVVLIGVQRLEIGKWVNNLGAMLKVLIILGIGVGAIVFAIRHGTANSFAVSDMLPKLNGATKAFLPVLVYQLLGFELVSSMAGEVKRPEKDIPRAIATSSLTIAFLYVLGTVGILLALNLKDIGLVTGLKDTFDKIFGTDTVLVYALGVAAIYTYFTNMTTWSMGANRSAVEAAQAGELPAVLGREHPVHRTPAMAFVIMGIVATAVLLFAAAFIKTQDSLYYALFAASSVIFLLPYLLLFTAFLRLRHIDADRPRPYRAPGGNVGAWLWAGVATAAIAASTILFLWPEIPNAPEDWSYTGPLLAIVAVTLIVGEILVARCMARLRRDEAAGARDA